MTLGRRPALPDPGARDPLLGFVGGAPGWLSATLTHCTRCGQLLAYRTVDGEHRERLVCDGCGHIAYVNPRLVVTTLPVTDDGDLVLLRRAIEPGLGLWAQPGGYLEADETAIQGAVRETREETGLEVEPLSIVGLYSRPQAAIVVVVFDARITGGALQVTSEALEVRAFAPDAIPWPEVAFDTTAWALGDWLRTAHPALAGAAPERARRHGVDRGA